MDYRQVTTEDLQQQYVSLLADAENLTSELQMVRVKIQRTEFELLARGTSMIPNGTTNDRQEWRDV